MVMAATVPRQGLDGGKKNLLFIDDDPIVQASLKMLFGRDFNIYNAGNAEEGIDLFEKFHPDVVLLDLRLPGKDGIDILRSIREHDQDTPVVIMTGYATLATAEESLRLGAVDYVHKPFDAIYLKNRVSELASLSPHKTPSSSSRAFAEALRRLNELELTENASSSFLHDVANPLTGLMTLTEFLRQSTKGREAVSPEKLRETLESISDNARYMAALVEHWRAFSEPQTLTREIVDLGSVVEIAIGLVKGRASDRNIRLDLRQTAQGISLKINRFALARVLANLLQNAIEAVDNNTGRVEITVRREKNLAKITVRDNGSGIPASLIGKVFEPRVTTKAKSMGLGLYISKKIVQSNGGDIVAQNLPGGGAEFTVSMEAENHDSSTGSR